jgi:hypothetical protein
MPTNYTTMVFNITYISILLNIIIINQRFEIS